MLVNTFYYLYLKVRIATILHKGSHSTLPVVDNFPLVDTIVCQLHFYLWICVSLRHLNRELPVNECWLCEARVPALCWNFHVLNGHTWVTLAFRPGPASLAPADTQQQESCRIEAIFRQLLWSSFLSVCLSLTSVACNSFLTWFRLFFFPCN